MKKSMCCGLSIIELKNARRNTENCYVGLCFWLLLMVVNLNLHHACVTVLNSKCYSFVVTTKSQ